MENQVLDWISQYGYLGIFGFLAFSLMGLPFPDVTMLTTVGYMVGSGRLLYWLCVVAAFAGASTGMCLSYWIGRKAGEPLVHRYGRLIQLTPEHLERAGFWFSRYGGWVVFFGYYVPGLRQVVNYVAGICGMSWPRYLLFAMSGAAVWVILFITAGREIAKYQDVLFHVIQEYRWTGYILLICLFIWLIHMAYHKYVSKRKKT